MEDKSAAHAINYYMYAVQLAAATSSAALRNYTKRRSVSVTTERCIQCEL